jgi:hypothetical protein
LRSDVEPKTTEAGQGIPSCPRRRAPEPGLFLDPQTTEVELLSQMDTYRICDFQTLTALFAVMLVAVRWMASPTCMGAASPM